MMIRRPPGWELPEREATPESVYLDRRRFLAALGLGSIAAARPADSAAPARNAEFVLDRPVTDEEAATSYNNFYEFHPTDKRAPRSLTSQFVIEPWSIEVTGLVEQPQRLDLDQLRRTMPIEERLYRHRCVEAWSMAVPWTGFPLAALLQLVKPKSEAKFIRFVTARRPDQMPGMKMASWYPWPYFEGLRLDEAMNPLAFVATGLYGKPLPKQNGAPVRLVMPWKYGYKSPKSIARIELVARRPSTFWHHVQPLEYGFYSNVNPKVPHPRWSQAEERLIPHGERRPTLLYNGYEKYVAGLYTGKEI